MSIKAPYNFVPLSEQVVFPHWGPFVSHDIPFSDSQSGELHLEIEAHSPIFVMDGMKEEASQVGEFARFNGAFLIPGSSVKGMIRSVLEIMTFSKIGDKVHDVSYAVRDFHNDDIYDKSAIASSVKTGWLRQEETGEYYLTPCSCSRLNTEQVHPRLLQQETAREKYDLCSRAGINVRNRSFEFDEEFSTESRGRTYKLTSNNGEIDGDMVFTGQPSSSKKRDFIFYDRADTQIIVDEQVVKNFFFANYDHAPNQRDKKERENWKFWRDKLDNGEEVPVFYRPEDGQIIDLGLSMLYKIVYNNSIVDAIKHTSQEHATNEQVDFSETIFGYVNDQRALKGRVHFSPATTPVNDEWVDNTHVHVLSSPKASYYPTYIKQYKSLRNGGVYKTLMEQDAEISGWKRYPIHGEFSYDPQEDTRSDSEQEEENDQGNVAVRFKPLKPKVKFRCVVRYHNLKKIELGALISAITFHGSKHGEAFHSIGMAKPLGYGKVTVEITNLNAEMQQSLLADFEAYMNACLSKNNEPIWSSSPQIKELMTMATAQKQLGTPSLEYMDIGMGNSEENEFEQAKKHNEYLQSYTKLSEYTAGVNTFVSPIEVEKMRAVVTEETRKYALKLPPVDAIAAHFDQTKTNARELLEQRKQIWLTKLEQQREGIRQKQAAEEKADREKIKGQRQKEAQKSGFNFSEINTSTRTSFKDLKKQLEKYLETYYGQKYKKLEEEHPKGMLPEMDLSGLKETVFAIAEQASKKVRGKLLNLPLKKNAYFKKVAEWIGNDLASKWLQELNNSK